MRYIKPTNAPIIFFHDRYRLRADEHAWIFEKYYSDGAYEKWHFLHNSRWLISILKIAREYFIKRSSKNDLTEILKEIESLMRVAMKSEETFLKEYLGKENHHG